MPLPVYGVYLVPHAMAQGAGDMRRVLQKYSSAVLDGIGQKRRHGSALQRKGDPFALALPLLYRKAQGFGGL